MLLEMAKKDDVKSLKKDISSLKEKHKSSKDPESQMEEYIKTVNKRIDEFEAHVNKSISSFSPSDDLPALKMLLETTAANLRQENNQTVKKLREKVNLNQQELTAKIYKASEDLRAELKSMTKKDKNSAVIQTIDELRNFTGVLAGRIDELEDALEESQTVEDELPGIERQSSRMSRTSEYKEGVLIVLYLIKKAMIISKPRKVCTAGYDAVFERCRKATRRYKRLECQN